MVQYLDRQFLDIWQIFLVHTLYHSYFAELIYWWVKYLLLILKELKILDIRFDAIHRASFPKKASQSAINFKMSDIWALPFTFSLSRHIESCIYLILCFFCKPSSIFTLCNACFHRTRKHFNFPTFLLLISVKVLLLI